jgi:hypothetical protein
MLSRAGTAVPGVADCCKDEQTSAAKTMNLKTYMVTDSHNEVLGVIGTDCGE